MGKRITTDAVVSENVLRQIECADPKVTKLRIASRHRAHPNNDWGRLGAAIGKNTCLRELQLANCHRDIPKIEWEKFFKGMARNRSIQKVRFLNCYVYGGKMFRILLPFFQNNTNFGSLEITACNPMETQCLRLLASVFGQFNSLSELKISSVLAQPTEVTANVIKSLIGHSGLRSVCLQYYDMEGTEGCGHFAAMLRDPKCRLETLALDHTRINDKGASILANGLEGNGTLREFNLSGQFFVMSSAGRQAIFTALSKPGCRIEKLRINHCGITAYDARSLGNALTNIVTLKDLDLGGNRSIAQILQSILDALRSSGCPMERLSLKGCHLSDDSLYRLADVLATINSIKTLNLAQNRRLSPGDPPRNTIAGWQALCRFLQRPECKLEDLDLSYNDLTDEIMASLRNVVQENGRLIRLNLACNIHVSPVGWESMAAVLQNRTSHLEVLNLTARGHNTSLINDRTAISLANSLVNNTRLKELYLPWNGTITSNGWSAFSRVLCNTSGIIETYRSNHSLQILTERETGLPEDLKALLRLNQQHSMGDAARLKTIQTHSGSGAIDSAPFLDIGPNVFPHVIAWVGSVGDGSDSRITQQNKINAISFLYKVMKGFPSICSSANVSDQRNKRTKIA